MCLFTHLTITEFPLTVCKKYSRWRYEGKIMRLYSWPSAGSKHCYSVRMLSSFEALEFLFLGFALVEMEMIFVCLFSGLVYIAFILFCFVFYIGSHSTEQAGFKLLAVFLPHLLSAGNYRSEPPSTA